MLRYSPKERLISRIAFYSAVLALLWVLEKVDANKQAATTVPGPAINGFVAQNLGY
jgi:hypothetical protein